ncbi:unnamed protein product [Callosobruchus maculatus]|uniref:Uncharacterized protein n=1 Tax=Callosobruchus maculatus TaxID=64391 RepID=A0A653BS11_CALMS|nr:unnamed protein product [Callosobruchus maculatus]
MCQDVMLVKALDCIVMCFWFMNNQQS